MNSQGNGVAVRGQRAKQLSLGLALVLALIWALPNSALASDEHEAPKPSKPKVVKPLHADVEEPEPAPSKGKNKPGSKAASKPKAEADDGAAQEDQAANAPDPLDVLREKLAAKLGPTRGASTDAPKPNVLRVTARSSSADLEVRAAPPAPRAPVRKPSPGAVLGASPAHAAKLAQLQAKAEHATAHWDYTGEGGPSSWGQLKPEFATCATGQRQSPIDIRDGIRVQLEPVMFDYRPSNFRVIDNGHTIQVNVSEGNSIEVQGRRFELLQFHFHRPSEERINGRQFDMVAHLVHKGVDGRLAVVAVLLDRGAAHPLVQMVWNNLPLEKGDEMVASTPLDLNALLPKDRSYYTYMGSLTTPPCSEGVLWLVMKTPATLSAEQINIFSRLYPMNARPIQSASGRLIKESN